MACQWMRLIIIYWTRHFYNVYHSQCELNHLRNICCRNTCTIQLLLSQNVPSISDFYSISIFEFSDVTRCSYKHFRWLLEKTRQTPLCCDKRIRIVNRISYRKSLRTKSIFTRKMYFLFCPLLCLCGKVQTISLMFVRSEIDISYTFCLFATENALECHVYTIQLVFALRLSLSISIKEPLYGVRCTMYVCVGCMQCIRYTTNMQHNFD